ncbi:hypothetical protein CYMTET_49349 [Cymbomonas tetramitiformis]|uniref:F-box domain-containing protein n=1 Tax=Cymbomonas tetramitiformis TaxID=36881 RepID=A0AAE0BRP7_9CHLO|nr:hypothetical protein CYMTET_49349 [Cymbomonas tetramitiformis]
MLAESVLPASSSRSVARTVGKEPRTRAAKRQKEAEAREKDSGEGLPGSALLLVFEGLPSEERFLVYRLVCKGWRDLFRPLEVWAPLLAASCNWDRLVALHAVGCLGEAAAPTVAAMIADKDHLVRSNAGKLLKKITLKKIGTYSRRQLQASAPSLELPDAAGVAAALVTALSSRLLKTTIFWDPEDSMSALAYAVRLLRTLGEHVAQHAGDSGVTQALSASARLIFSNCAACMAVACINMPALIEHGSGSLGCAD